MHRRIVQILIEMASVKHYLSNEFNTNNLINASFKKRETNSRKSSWLWELPESMCKESKGQFVVMT